MIPDLKVAPDGLRSSGYAMKSHLASGGRLVFLSVELAVNCYYVITYLALIFPLFNKDYAAP